MLSTDSGLTIRFTLLIRRSWENCQFSESQVREHYRPLDSTNTNSVDRTITSGANDSLEGNLLHTNQEPCVTLLGTTSLPHEAVIYGLIFHESLDIKWKLLLFE